MKAYTPSELNCRGCNGPCGQCDLTPDFIDAITRELEKRKTTYPKIIAKKIKKGMPSDEVSQMISMQQAQVRRLEGVLNFLQTGLDYSDAPTAADYLTELDREMKMRKRYYPRMVYFKRIDQETAAYELAIWILLIDFFKQKYLCP